MSQHVVKLYNKQYTLDTDKLYSVFVKVDIIDQDGKAATRASEPNQAVIVTDKDGVQTVVLENSVQLGGKGSRKRRVRKPRTTMKK
jgi:hypothetical protein